MLRSSLAQTRVGCLTSEHRSWGGLASLRRIVNRSFTVPDTRFAGFQVAAWALLEAPEYAVDLYRNEIGAIRALWETEMVARFPESAWLLWGYWTPSEKNPACDSVFGH